MNASIRLGTADDAPACQRIAYQWRAELGRVMRPALVEAAGRGDLYVAEHDGQVVGFANTRTRRDGWHTVYEIAVDRAVLGQGIGHALLDAVPRPVRLKCVATNERASRFYKAAGLRVVRTENARTGTLLAVWEGV